MHPDKIVLFCSSRVYFLTKTQSFFHLMYFFLIIYYFGVGKIAHNIKIQIKWLSHFKVYL